ncbi:NBR1-Ig-like domain-containing protein [Xanthomonas fragariae]|uniref:NBR1-Ig-like domain-containing protein n=1 Tax=Xanthomonas fragariae TaxID=48664 RepID=UPI0022AA8AF7|nr:NBR1-Ig-like domain-containing protein [Xanthomonas fragariae]WAT14905.1 NBR1-Ig-like domain-containing protein [Xanthomonas fragariae]
MDHLRLLHLCCLRARITVVSACIVLGFSLPQPARAAQQCPDGAAAGRGEECPRLPPRVLPQLAAQFVFQSVPTTMVVGQPYAASIMMRNTGQATWSASSAFNLGSQNPSDNGTWGTGRVAVPGSVVTGASASFNFTARAPLTAGTYNFQWRMVQDGVSWFGPPSPNQSIEVLASDIKGTIDAIAGNTIRGWACSTHLDIPIDVHLYLGGGAAGTGTMSGAFRADNASESAVASACLANGSGYRFSLPISEDMIVQHAGAPIYVYGISPVAAANATLGGSGNFRIPAISRNAAFAGQSVPTTMTVGQSYPVEVNFRNTGVLAAEIWTVARTAAERALAGDLEGLAEECTALQEQAQESLEAADQLNEEAELLRQQVAEGDAAKVERDRIGAEHQDLKIRTGQEINHASEKATAKDSEAIEARKRTHRPRAGRTVAGPSRGVGDTVAQLTAAIGNRGPARRTDRRPLESRQQNAKQ